MQFINDYADNTYDGHAVRDWLIKNVDVAAAVAGLYLAFVFCGPDLLEKYVFPLSSGGSNNQSNSKTKNDGDCEEGNSNKKKKPAAKSPLLRWSWASWNLLLAIFSLYGSATVTPVVLHKVRTIGWRGALCSFDDQEYYFGRVGLALGLYCLSKGPELMDTVFLLLSGKKTLPFLQWFHHVTTFLFCWHAYAVGSSALQFAAALNYSVHTVMYFYFFLAESGFKNLVKPFGFLITLVQIAQMFVGTGLIGAIINFKIGDAQSGVTAASEGACNGCSWSIARVQIFIAGVNLVLFTDFFLSAYVFKKKRPATSAAAATVDNGHSMKKN